MAAWSSANKYSLMGGIRAAAQLIAYELPLVLAAAAVAMQAGSADLAVHRGGPGAGWGYVVGPLVIGFFVFGTAALAELNRPPFDMPVADSELIFGHLTEYTGLRFAFFLLTEYAGIVSRRRSRPPCSSAAGRGRSWTGRGGWRPRCSPWRSWSSGSASTYPRLREDQLQSFAWLRLVPVLAGACSWWSASSRSTSRGASDAGAQGESGCSRASASPSRR